MRVQEFIETFKIDSAGAGLILVEYSAKGTEYIGKTKTRFKTFVNSNDIYNSRLLDEFVKSKPVFTELEKVQSVEDILISDKIRFRDFVLDATFTLINSLNSTLRFLPDLDDDHLVIFGKIVNDYSVKLMAHMGGLNDEFTFAKMQRYCDNKYEFSLNETMDGITCLEFLVTYLYDSLVLADKCIPHVEDWSNVERIIYDTYPATLLLNLHSTKGSQKQFSQINDLKTRAYHHWKAKRASPQEHHLSREELNTLLTRQGQPPARA